MGEFGECAVCGGDLPKPNQPSRPRTICDNADCRYEVNRYGASIINARRRRTLEQVTSRSCSFCDADHPLTEEFFYVTDSEAPTSAQRFDRWCKVRRRASQKLMREQRGDELRALNRKQAAERKRRSNEQQRVEARERHRIAQQRWRDANPERAKAIRDRYRARVRADKQRSARQREAARMTYRLRKERERGVHITDLRLANVRLPKDRVSGVLPAAPLVAALDRYCDQHELSYDDVYDIVGIHARQINAWKTGEIERVQIAVADKALVGADLLWWEVWEPGTDGYDQARRLFEGDSEQEAA